MALLELNVYPRQTKGKNANRRTRAAGRVPGTLYGKTRESVNIEVDGHQFDLLVGGLGGASVIFALKQEGDDADAIALLREVQRNPVSDEVLHVDLMEIPRGVPIEVPVRVEPVGQPPAIKRGDAVLAQIMESVEISCLPRDLPDSIEVDISGLDTGDRLYVKDLKTPVGEITDDPEALVLLLRAPTVFVEEEEAAEEGEAEDEAAAEKGDEEKKDKKEKKDAEDS
jgi:large subunit ribosomal protein L25